MDTLPDYANSGLANKFDYAPSDDDGHKISPQEAVHEKASEPKAIEHQSLPTVNALENDLAIEESNSKDADDDFDGGLNDQDMDDAFDAFDASTALE